VIFTSIPLLVLLIRLPHGKGGGEASPFRYGYAVLIYVVSIPGMFSTMLCLYAQLFTEENLLGQSIVIDVLSPSRCLSPLMPPLAAVGSPD